MGFLNYRVRPRVLVVGNGHTYDRTALMAMFESFDGMECFLVEHPLAEKVLNPSALADVDALVFYDMPGGDPWSGPGYQAGPTPAMQAGFAGLLQAGMPIVALHHAIAHDQQPMTRELRRCPECGEVQVALSSLIAMPIPTNNHIADAERKRASGLRL